MFRALNGLARFTRSVSTAVPRVTSTSSLATAVSLALAGGYALWNAPSTDNKLVPAPFLRCSDRSEGPMVRAIEKAMPSVVRIYGEREGGYMGSIRAAASGSGFIVTEDGLVATNSHVIEGFQRAGIEEFRVYFANGEVYRAVVKARDALADVGLLQILPHPGSQSLPKFPSVKFGKSSELKSGDWVAVLGAPLGGRHSVTQGIFSHSTYVIDDHSFEAQGMFANRGDWCLLQVDAQMLEGNSGGPVVNGAGEVIGISVMGKVGGALGGMLGAISYAVASDQAAPIIQQLVKTKHVTRGKLDMTIRVVNNIVDGVNSVPPGYNTAIKVMDVNPGPARDAGIRAGDYVIAINGRPATRKGIYYEELGPVYEEGKTITFTILRHMPPDPQGRQGSWKHVTAIVKPIPHTPRAV